MTSFLNPTFLLSILIALSVHEAAHAYVAYKLGDHTAKVAGRLTLNPIAHLDPLGTLLFIFVGFGWGKPVPVNPYHFKNPKRDSALTAFAGPVSNLILVIIAMIILRIVFGGLHLSGAWSLLMHPAEDNVVLTFVHNLLLSSVFVNLGLMAFNLLPVAPLDGSKVLQAFIPLRYEDEYDQYMNYGPYILLGLLLAGRFTGLDILSWWIEGIMEWALRALMLMFQW